MLNDRIALVTGASSGIGAACARALAEKGATLIVTGRRGAALEQLAEEIGGRAIVADLRDRSEIDRLFDGCGERLDILVNSAGIAPKAPIIDGDYDDFRTMLEVNVLALAYCCQHALKKFDGEGGGHIINISSKSGQRVPQSGGFYAPTKFAVRAVTESLRNELRAAGSHTKVATISPGWVETPLVENYFGGNKDALDRLKHEIHMLQPEDIARAVLHVIEAPAHVDVNDIQLRPTKQSI